MKNILTATLFIIITIALFFKYLNNVSIEFYSTRFVSNSIEDAIKKGVFVKKVKVNPERLDVGNETIKFKQCWIEEKTQTLFRFLFFKTIKKLGNFNLCFTLENKPSDNIDTKFRFLKEDSEFGFVCMGGKVYYNQLDSLNNRNIKVILLEGQKIIKYSKKLAEIFFSF